VNSDFNLTSLCDISVDVYFTNPNSTLQNHLSTDTYIQLTLMSGHGFVYHGINAEFLVT